MYSHVPLPTGADNFHEKAFSAWWSLLAKIGRGKFKPASLENRDPEWIRLTLPALKLIRDHYFKGRVDGIGNLPEGPYVLVGMHGGGPMNVFADNLVLFSSVYETLGPTYPFYVIAHHIVFYLGPIGRLMAKYGAVDLNRDAARTILDRGQGFIVFPGGEEDMARPYWRKNRVDFRGHQGFVDVALAADAPIVPIGEVGGHETEIVLSPGYGIAKRFHLDKIAGLKTFPIALTIPWGLTIGYLPYIPYPARIHQRIGKPMHFSPSATEKTDPAYREHVAKQVEREVQRLVDELAEERKAGNRRSRKCSEGEANRS